MSRNRRNKLLVPEAREALDGLMNHVMETKSGRVAGGEQVPNAQDKPSGMGTGAIINQDGQLVARHNAAPQGAAQGTGVDSPSTSDSKRSKAVAGVAASVGVPYDQNGDNGNLTTRQAGKIGGQIGGSMVKRLIAIAEEELARENGLKH